MKTLKDSILTEGLKKGLIEYKVNYDLNSDLYNLMECLVDQYSLKNKQLTLKDLEMAFEFFAIHSEDGGLFE